MPRKRAANGWRLRYADLSFTEKFALFSNWWHPDCGRSDLRFSTWAEYFDTYEAVRGELLPTRKWTPFAELALPVFRAGGDPLSVRAAYDTAFRDSAEKLRHA